MKKILIFSMVFSLAFATIGLAMAEEQPQAETRTIQETPNLIAPSPTASGEQLEKILSPKDITFFEKIKKIGNALFGIKKKNAGKQAEVKKQEEPAAEVSGSAEETAENLNLILSDSGNGGEEKIFSPNDIKLFEKIKKVGNALYGIRKKTVLKPLFIKPENAGCIKSALSVKGTSLKVTMMMRNEKVLAAHDARIACEIATLDKATAIEQYKANLECFQAEQKSRKEIDAEFNKGKKATQDTFRTDVKTCVQTTATTTPAAN